MESQVLQHLIQSALSKFGGNQTKLAAAVGLKRSDVCRFANGYFKNPKILSVLPLFCVLTDDEVIELIRTFGGPYVDTRDTK